MLLRAKLESISLAVTDAVDSEEDVAWTIEEYKDQVTQIKTELTTLNASLLSSDVPAEDPVRHTFIESLKLHPWRMAQARRYVHYTIS